MERSIHAEIKACARKDELVAMYTTWISVHHRGKTDREFASVVAAINKRLREVDPDHEAEHKQSQFWAHGVKIDEMRNLYNKPHRTEALGLVFNAMHLDSIGDPAVDESTFLVPDSQGGPARLLHLARFTLSDGTEAKAALRAHSRRFFPGIVSFDFLLRSTAAIGDGEERGEFTATALMQTARHGAHEKILRVEEKRVELAEHMEKYKPPFEGLRMSALETRCHDSDGGEESGEESGDGPAKRQKVDNTDPEDQKVDNFFVRLHGEGGIKELRVQLFRGELAPHAVELLGSLYSRELLEKHLPRPTICDYDTGADTYSDGVTLVAPGSIVNSNTAMTQKLIDSGLRDAYERMLRLHRDLKQGIKEVASHLLRELEFVIDTTNADGAVTRTTPDLLSPGQRYALGLLYMDEISVAKPPEEEEDEEESGESEEDEEDEDDASYAEESDDSEDDDSDASHSGSASESGASDDE